MLLVATLLGCPAMRREPRLVEVPPGKPLAEIPAEDLLEILAARGAAIQSLRSVAKLKVTIEAATAEEADTQRFSITQAVLASAPASFRLESLSPFGVSYAVVSNGSQIAALAPQEGTIYRGRASAETVASATGVEATPSDISRILLGLPPMPRVEERLAWLSQPDASTLAASGNAQIESAVILHVPSAERRGDTVVVGLVRFQGDPAVLPITFERIDANGRSELRVELASYERAGGWPVPTLIEVWAPGSHATLEYRDIELNPQVSADQFQLATPSGMRDVPLVPTSTGSDPRSRP